MYSNIQKDFLEYISFCRSQRFYAISENVRTGELILNKTDYNNRWALKYKMSFLVKLYKLQNFYNKYYDKNTLVRITRSYKTGKFQEHYWRPGAVTFMTITMRTNNKMFIPWQLDELRDYFRKFKDSLFKYLGKKLEYIGNLDFHESGFGHYHIIWFGSFSKEDMEYIKNIWSKKYGLGSYDRGIVEERVPQDRLNFVVAYVLRHSAKLFDLDFEEPGSLLFSSCVWFMNNSEDFSGIRYIVCSRNISHIMKLNNIESEYKTLSVKRVRSCKNGGVEILSCYTSDESDVQKVNDYYNYLISC